MARTRPANRLSPYFYRKLRAEILEERGYRCEGCGRTYTEEDAEYYLDLDHILSRARGGGDTRENLRVLCRGECHPRRTGLNVKHGKLMWSKK